MKALFGCCLLSVLEGVLRLRAVWGGLKWLTAAGGRVIVCMLPLSKSGYGYGYGSGHGRGHDHGKRIAVEEPIRYSGVSGTARELDTWNSSTFLALFSSLTAIAIPERNCANTLRNGVTP